MVAILVTDTSIWIDLIKSGLLENFFNLPYTICTSVFIKEYETIELDWDELSIKGLHFLELSEEEIGILYDLKQAKRKLSLPDIASYLNALDVKGILLTGDQNLRSFAKNYVEVHGFLWVIDMIVGKKLINPLIAIKIIKDLLEDPNVRLPLVECKIYIKKWKRMIL